jgi:hypothetical protein
MTEPKRYRAVVGLNFTPARSKEEVRIEPEEEVVGLPAAIAKQLLSMGAIEEVKE